MQPVLFVATWRLNDVALVGTLHATSLQGQGNIFANIFFVAALHATPLQTVTLFKAFLRRLPA